MLTLLDFNTFAIVISLLTAAFCAVMVMIFSLLGRSRRSHAIPHGRSNDEEVRKAVTDAFERFHTYRSKLHEAPDEFLASLDDRDYQGICTVMAETPVVRKYEARRIEELVWIIRGSGFHKRRRYLAEAMMNPATCRDLDQIVALLKPWRLAHPRV